jgi:hypothetical protein
MKGHQSIVKARLQNKAVDAVWVVLLNQDQPANKAFEYTEDEIRYATKVVNDCKTFYPELLPRFLNDPENMIDMGFSPEIMVYRNDAIARLDFRCLVGTVVHLSGDNVERTMRVSKRIQLFKPRLLLTVAGGVLITESNKQVAA